MADNFNEKDEYDGDINALYELNKSVHANDLVRHHRFVKEYYAEFNDNREMNHNFVRGFHYDGDELRKYRDKRKTPVVFNQIKTSERTILGLFLQNKYDVKFSANSPTDDDIGEVLEQLDTWEQEQQGDEMLDIDLIRLAWAGGNSFQECYMEVSENKEPLMHTVQQNSFAVYWDPESRRLITREDAQFFDRDSWMTFPELSKRFKKEADEISEQLVDRKQGGDSYDEVTVFADRDHEFKKERNGQYLVTERFYKVDGVTYFADMEDGTKVEIDEEDLKTFKKENPNVEVVEEEAEELWLAIVCEEFSNQNYLYNDKYHNQPRDPRSGKIIWPMLEMVAESLAGEPQGFVDHERGPNKVVNAMMSNIVSSATHAAAQSMLIDPTAFVSEKEARLAARHHADSDRSFQVKHGRTGDAMAPVPKSTVSADHQYALDYSLNFLKEVTSTPPSLQGQEEKAGVSGVLNAQRIEQGFTQLQVIIKNYILFMKQRAKLRYYYWRTYYTAEKTFRIIDKSEPDMNPFQTINQMVPDQDAMGSYTGIKKLNDINAAVYDITIEESVKSATYRNKQLKTMETIMNSGYAQNDPGLFAALLEEILRLSDAPQKIRTFLKKHSQSIQQADMATKQAEQQYKQAQTEGQDLSNQAQMQGIAQTEAEQTGINRPGAAMPQPRVG